jgi:hypothetical protein
MSEQNNGGPAFPRDATNVQMAGKLYVDEGEQGMSLLDFFAAKALQGICAHADSWGLGTVDQIAEQAYLIAGAMLRAREA